MELVGLEIVNASPFQEAWIPLRSGLTVLYGPNGAGKTTVLDALGCASTGMTLAAATGRRQSECRLYLRLDRDEPAFAALGPAAEEVGADDKLLRILHPTTKRRIEHALTTQWSTSEFPLTADERRRLALEIADQSLLALIPRGEMLPLWELVACARPTEDTPTLRGEIGRVRHEWSALPDPVDFDEEGDPDAQADVMLDYLDLPDTTPLPFERGDHDPWGLPFGRPILTIHRLQAENAELKRAPFFNRGRRQAPPTSLVSRLAIGGDCREHGRTFPTSACQRRPRLMTLIRLTRQHAQPLL